MTKITTCKTAPKTAPSKWTVFVIDRDYTEDELYAHIYSMGLRSATPEDLPDYMPNGWDWKSVIDILDSEFEEDGKKYLVGLVRPIVWNKILTRVEKPQIFRAYKWRFLLKSK